ncbi:MAG: DUF4199 domain-containing protein [Bacteroidota bacterium]
MKPTLKAGILLGVFASIWALIVMISGLYEIEWLFATVATLIVLLVLIWGLRQTAREGKSYGGQLGAGILMAVIGGVIIFCTSLLLTSVLFPDYLGDVASEGVETMRADGASEAEIDTYVAAQQTNPLLNALMGFLGTVGTGIVASLIISIFIKNKGSIPQGQEVSG